MLLALLAAATATLPAEAAAFTQRTGITLTCQSSCPSWTPLALDDFEAALAALPEPLRHPKGLTLVLHRWTMPFAMGDGSLRRPDWSKDGAAFHVYGAAPTTERRAALRLSNLTDAEQASLWRRRALVHALLKRADDEHGLSRADRWRRISVWSGNPITGDSASNVYEGAYSRVRGQSSPKLDLLTFAEEHFIPVESLKPDALAADDRIACQELIKSRILHTLLFEKRLVPAPYVRARCGAFEGWAQLSLLEAFEVLLVASSGRKPESLFGHLLLRPTHRQGELVRGPTFQSAIQIVAITDGAKPSPEYLARGIFGGYRTAVVTLSNRDFEREVLEDEQRVIRRFRLQLTPDENERMMERVWDLERRGYFAYRFFTENCASTLADVVNAALDEQTHVEMPGAVIVAPSSALDGFGRIVRMKDGRRSSLLQREGVDIEPSSLIAERALAARANAIEAWTAERAPFERTAVTAQFEALSADTAQTRSRAYGALATWPPATPTERKAQFDFWLASVRIEKFAVDRARKALLQLSVDTLTKPLVAGHPDDQVRDRQLLFERESNLAPHYTELDRADAAKERIARLPHRPLTEAEQLEEERHLATLALWRTVTALQGDVVERDHAGGTTDAALASEQRAELQAQKAWEPNALLSSGAWRLGVGPSFDRSRGALRIHSAGLSERLGDQRVRGFQPSTELHFLDADTTLTFEGVLPRIQSSDFTVFGWRSLGRTPAPLRESFREALGYGLSIATDHRALRPLSDRVRFDFEVFAVLDESKSFDRHLALGVGPRVLGAFGLSTPTGLPEAAAMAGPRAVLLQRLPLWGHSANTLRVEAAVAPLWSVGAQRGLNVEAQAALEVDVRIVVAGGVLLLRPRLTFELDRTRRAANASLLIEPVEWHLQ